MGFINLCCRSESVSTPSPHHLSWLALEAYNSLFTDEEVGHSLCAVQTVHCIVTAFVQPLSVILSLQDKLPGYVQKLVEFRLLLYSTKGVTSFSARVAVSVVQ